MIEPRKLERLFREANRRAEAHQYDGAIAVYRQVITLAGDDDPLAAECAHWGIGEASLSAGKYTQALTALQSALEYNPGEAAYHYLLGIVYTRLGARENALTALGRAFELEPQNLKVLRAYGWALHRFGSRRRGMKMLREALAIKADDSLTLTDLGWAFAVEGRFGESCVCLEKAHACDPTNLTITAALATAERFDSSPPTTGYIPATGPVLLSLDEDWEDEDDDLDGEDDDWEDEIEDDDEWEDEEWEDDNGDNGEGWDDDQDDAVDIS